MHSNKSLSTYVGLLGGSFNPPHLGHLAVAHAACGRFALSQVWMMITPQNPEKELPAVSFEHRKNMCALMVEHEPCLKVSTFEQDEKTYNTRDTLKRLAEVYPDQKFIWIMGSDNLQTCHEWEGWDDIMHQMPVVIYSRHGFEDLESTAPMVQKYKAHQKNLDDSFQELPNWRLFPDPVHPASSTNIRRTVEGHEEIFDLDVKVANYIVQHGLYQD